MAKKQGKGERKEKKKALGRGLSALISSKAVPTTAPKGKNTRVVSMKGRKANEGQLAVDKDAISLESEDLKERIVYLDIKQVISNPIQPRQIFNPKEIAQLSDSIKSLGVLHPVLVRPKKDKLGVFELVAGERRWRAAKEAKLPQIPVIIRDLDNRQALEIAIVENVQRSNLSPLEEAEAYKRLMDEFSLNQREIAEKVGKDRASIANFIRLLKLPQEVLEFLRKEKISMGHAKAILTVREPSAQVSLAKKVIKENLSVRALETIVSRVVVLDTQRKKKRSKNAGLVDGPFADVVEQMRRIFGTKVNIKHHKSGRGKIEIEYYSESELDRLIDKMGVFEKGIKT